MAGRRVTSIRSRLAGYVTGAVLAIVSSLAAVPANAGYAHLLVDGNTGKVLASDNADVLNHPASLTKMMTLYMVFEALRDGRLSWDQKIKMSRNGAATIPTKLGIPAGKTFTVREAVYGMIVRSANDVAEGMGDHLAGSEAKFGQMMTRRARQLGMKKTVFRNASGLPDRRQVTTARDMATLGLALMRDFPKEYRLFATKSFKFRGRTIRGHNNLMYRYKGMDGIKTGYINASGCNVVSAINHDGKRVVGVVLGGKTARGRDNRMAALLDKAMPKASATRTRQDLVASAAPRRDFALPDGDVPLPVFAYRGDPIARKIAISDAEVADRLAPRTLSDAAAAVGTGRDRSQWEVQIAATDSQASAVAMLSRAQTQIDGRFSGIAPYTEQLASGLVRARFTGFDSRDAAQSACATLKRHDYACLVLGSEG